jgi:hypothetical protein
MTTHSLLPNRLWLWRGLAALTLLLGGLALAPVALANDAAPSTITLYAPGAVVGTQVSVQRQVGAGWVTELGSPTTLFGVTYLGVPYESWTVDPSNYGQGPFRWVVDNIDGSVWAISDPFFLPEKGGLDLALTLSSAQRVGLAPKLGVQSITMPVPAFQAPMLKASLSGESTFCHLGDCASAAITAYITGLPADSWIAIEWQDPQGYWHPVTNWEGSAQISDPGSNVMYMQWVVMPALYGHGPFRWAVYAGANGGVWGVSPTFNLPSGDRQNNIFHLSPQ